MSSKLTVVHHTLAGIALAAAISFAATPAVRAEDDCQKRIAEADHKLHESELAEARSYCWEHAHRWWDEDDEHRWHDQRDWDDRDHDRH